jgi:hypothetical protein
MGGNFLLLEVLVLLIWYDMIKAIKSIITAHADAINTGEFVHC